MILHGFILNVYLQFVNWVESMELSCPTRKYFHMQCPGCGFQRSMIALMKGELLNSFKLYPPLVPILLLLGFVVLHLRKPIANGTSIIRYSQATVVILILANYIYKIINHQIFV